MHTPFCRYTCFPKFIAVQINPARVFTNPISLASVALRTNDVKCKREQDEKRSAVLEHARPRFNLLCLPVEPKTKNSLCIPAFRFKG